MPGGKKAEGPVGDNTRALVAQLKPDIEAKAGQTFHTFELISERTQVVAGINHFVKIKIGEGQYLHVTIWQKAVGDPTVTNVYTGKTETDPL